MIAWGLQAGSDSSQCQGTRDIEESYHGLRRSTELEECELQLVKAEIEEMRFIEHTCRPGRASAWSGFRAAWIWIRMCFS